MRERVAAGARVEVERLRHVKARSLLTRALPALVATMSLGCTKSEAQLEADDRAQIVLLITEDQRASRAMAEADDATRKGTTDVALQALDERARPAIEAGLRAGHADLKTEWGRSRRDTFVRILEDRRAELGRYSDAIKSGDADKLIGAIEAQAKIERRAMAAIAEVGR